MVGAGRVLTHPPALVARRAEDGPCAAYAAALDIASLFTGMVLFRHLMNLLMIEIILTRYLAIFNIIYIKGKK